MSFLCESGEFFCAIRLISKKLKCTLINNLSGSAGETSGFNINKANKPFI